MKRTSVLLIEPYGSLDVEHLYEQVTASTKIREKYKSVARPDKTARKYKMVISREQGRSTY